LIIVTAALVVGEPGDGSGGLQALRVTAHHESLQGRVTTVDLYVLGPSTNRHWVVREKKNLLIVE
jgi:GTPase